MAPLLSCLEKEGFTSQRALALMNALVERQKPLPTCEDVGRLLAASRPEAVSSPFPPSSPEVEEPLSHVAKAWKSGAVQFLPLVHALWAGERGAAAAGAAAGAIAVASGLEEGDFAGTGASNKPLDTWSWKVAEKFGRDVRQAKTYTSRKRRSLGDAQARADRDRDPHVLSKNRFVN